MIPSAASAQLFVKPGCPHCLKLAEYSRRLPLSVTITDASTPHGSSLAQSMGINICPMLIIFNSEHKEIIRAGSQAELDEIFQGHTIEQ